jgi:hypothetical protein
MRLISPLGRSGKVVFLALVASVGAAGCGSSTSTVSGKVYYNGQPLPGGNVAFVGEKKTVSAEIQEDGSYQAEKVPVGKVTITVETNSIRPPRNFIPKNEPPKGKKRPGSIAQKDPNERFKRFRPIPDKYGDPKQSPLSYEVTRDNKQVHDIKVD